MRRKLKELLGGEAEDTRMSLRLFRINDPSERETEALLAWYVNGTLDTSEHAWNVTSPNACAVAARCRGCANSKRA